MRKILVIDDDKSLSSVIKSVLEYENYNVLVANDAKAGILIAEEESPDLIILDIIMPGMDGSEAVAFLKSKDSTRDIPIIFLTGLVSSADEEQMNGINIGGIYHEALAKPFDNMQLIKIVKNILESEKA